MTFSPNYFERTQLKYMDNKYKIMPSPQLCGDGITLRAVEPNDIEFIRRWRNAQMDVLRQVVPISIEEQKEYFAKHVWPEKESSTPKQILLAILREGVFIGYGGLVHICWDSRRAELSFLLDPLIESEPETRGSVFLAFLVLSQRIAFKDLHLSRLWTETYSTRTAHLHTLEIGGFKEEGRLRAHSIIENRPVDSIIHGLLASEWNTK